METFLHIAINSLGFNPQKKGDLLYYEGPMLSHFQDPTKSNEHFFYRWVDYGENVNRWLIFKNSDADVLAFLNNACSELDLIEKNPYLILLDLDENLNKVNILLTSLSDVPNAYLPSNKAFFDETIYEPYALKLKKQVENAMQKQDAMQKLIEKIDNLENEQNAAQKVIADMKLILESVTNK